jgi:hypothetical protein
METGTPRAEKAGQFVALTEQETQNEEARGSLANTVLSGDPNHAPALMVRAARMVKEGKTKAAIDDLSNVLKQFQDFAPAQQELAALYSLDKDRRAEGFALAIKARTTLENLAVKPPDLARTLAVLSFYKGEYSFAVSLFKEAPPAGPHEAEQNYCLGMAFWNLKQEGPARDALNKALQSGKLPEDLAAEAKKITTAGEGK